MQFFPYFMNLPALIQFNTDMPEPHDTDHAGHQRGQRIINSISGKKRNLRRRHKNKIICPDDDQTIYGLHDHQRGKGHKHGRRHCHMHMVGSENVIYIQAGIPEKHDTYINK